MSIQTCLYPCACVCTLPFICIPLKNWFSHLSHSRCWQKHRITLAGCKFPAHWSSLMPRRSKTDWNLCSYSSISSVTWLCQHLSKALPNKLTVLLAASFQVFTFTGKNCCSLLLPEVMLACIKIWSEDLWSSDLSVILCVKKSQVCRNYLLPIVSYCFLNRTIEGTAFRCIARKFPSDLSPCTMAWFDFQRVTRVITLSLSFLFLAMMPSVVYLKCQKRHWIFCFRYFL